jgi:hypothetical protein
MPLITIFSAPKPFTDPFIAAIQRNAIRSWIELGDQVEILLVGDEPGMAEAVGSLGVRHVRGVECNEWGTPLVRSIFSQARAASKSPLMAIVNADIVLFDDFLQAARRVSEMAKNFLVFGRRHGMDIEREIDFEPGWQERLRQQVREEGQLHPIFSIDYFIFGRQQYQEIPDFVIGRPQWDNWMIYHARKQGWLVVDATPSVLAIHQNHDYRHLPGGRPPHGLEEGKRNRKMAGGVRTRYLILDAEWVLEGGTLRRPKFSLERSLRKLELALMGRLDNRIAARSLPFVRRLRRRAGDPLPTDGPQWGAGARRKREADAEEDQEG